MNTRQNTLAAIRYERPERVPLFDGTVWEAVQLGGNFRYESWTDDWGTEWQLSGQDMVPVDVGHPLADLGRIDTYQWPDPHSLTWTADDQAHLDTIDRDRVLVCGLHIKFLCERLCCLMGMEDFMVSLYEDADRLKVLIDRIVDYNVVCFRRLIDLGIDVLSISEDLGTQDNLLIAPELFRQFLLPAYERCLEEPLKQGVLIDFHSCGCIMDIVPDLVSLGVSVLNPLQAAANDQCRVKADVMGRTAILGGINSTVVHRGTPDDVRREVTRAFEVLKPGGGWLAGPDQVINGAPADNVKALWDTCAELCAY